MLKEEHHHSLREGLLGWFVGGTKLEELLEKIEPWVVDIALELGKIRVLMEEGLPVEVMNEGAFV